MSTFDITKRAKVVAMADSVHDSEALAAVRRANRMLKDADKTWADVLSNPEAGARRQPRPVGREHTVTREKND